MNTPTQDSGGWRVTLAALLPLIVLLVIFLALYLPGYFIQPGYDFLYSDTSRSGQFYDQAGKPIKILVRNDRLVSEPGYSSSSDYYYNTERATIYYHNTATNQSREVPLEEMGKYELATGKKSPDGFSLDLPSDSIGPFDLMIGGGQRNYILSRGWYHREQKLELPGYAYGFNFYGWVERDGAR